ncbi:MAG TPA: amidohydrolase family protein [Steroidobacteraceae bacterium]|jgi:5-methylthioadenosine/S-adenosylhomocysteine deaminase|nr:amidohydrolase family protein [Steroidobacteraceae bacterium]
MPTAPADLRIEARWIVPVPSRKAILEDHALLIRDARILDILPSAVAAERYSARAVLQRNTHLLTPGLINARSTASALLFRGINGSAAAVEPVLAPDFARDGTLAAIAEMLRSGITCFCDRSFFPEETARAANEQGMRAVLGMPVTDSPTLWAKDAAQSMTRALRLRDAYKGDPLVSTAFAPLAANNLSDATFARLVTLADELDAGIMIDLHQSTQEIDACLAAHGMRPLERLWNLGLLTPALNAAHMVQLSAGDMHLLQRTGISITVCPQGDLKQGEGLPPVAAFAAAGTRLAIGSAGAAALSQDIWGDMKIVGLLASAWDALHAATQGGASALGLEAETGTLETGKWADICCADLSRPGTQPVGDPVAQLVFGGSRDIVSDVWVAGRQLLSGAELTRLDWPDVAARSAAWAARMTPRG